MKRLTRSSVIKSVAFLIVATIITVSVSFATKGLSSMTEDENDSGNADQDVDIPTLDGESDNNIDEEDIPTVKPVPEYFDIITGLETTKEKMSSKHISYLVDSSTSIYGISSSLMTVEFPFENGKTRLALVTDSTTSLGKIGALAPNRKFINTFLDNFDCINISFGNDDTFEYDEDTKVKSDLNLKAESGYFYTEFSNFVYSNGDLIKAFIKNKGLNFEKNTTLNTPYNFNGFYDAPILGDSSASKINISYSNDNTTEFQYSKDLNKYIVSKNNVPLTDSLNDKNVSYDNVFILYADSTTKETSKTTTTILDTKNGGSGIYISNGTKTEIKWFKDSEGNLQFFNSMNEKLTVNRGVSYICFQKSSEQKNVQIF